MQTEMMDLIKKFNESSLEASKRISDLNMKTFEGLANQQSAFFTSCFDLGSKSLEAMSKAKDPQEMLQLQQKSAQAYGEQWVNTARASAELLTSARDEYASITEDAMKTATSNFEQASTLGKQAFTKNMEDASQAVEKAAEKASAMTEQAVAATKEMADKAAEISQEVTKRAVTATHKAADEMKAAA